MGEYFHHLTLSPSGMPRKIVFSWQLKRSITSSLSIRRAFQKILQVLTQFQITISIYHRNCTDFRVSDLDVARSGVKKYVVL